MTLDEYRTLLFYSDSFNACRYSSVERYKPALRAFRSDCAYSVLEIIFLTNASFRM